MVRLNLLPTKEKNLIRRQRLQQLIVVSLLIFVISASIVSLELFWGKQLLKDNFPSYDISLNRNKLLVENVKKINFNLTTIDKIQKEYIPISPIFIALSEIASDNLQIRLFNFDKEKKSFQLRGWANSREDLLTFQTNLEKIEFFKSVKTPVSNLLKQQDIDFELSGELNL